MNENIRIIDIVNGLPKHATKRYSKRDVSKIHSIVVHHFAGDSTPQNVAMYHIKLKYNSLGQPILHSDWPGIGYHYVVNKDGTIFQTNYHDTMSFHAGDINTYSIGIALNGNFTSTPPPQEQLDSVRWLINYLRQHSGLNITNVMGHRQAPGAQTACPGNTWRAWLPYVTGDVPVSPPLPPLQPTPTPGDTYTVRSGDTLSGIAAKFNTSLSVLLILNPEITNPNLIKVGQVILLSKVEPYPNPEPPTPDPVDPPPPVDPDPTLPPPPVAKYPKVKVLRGLNVRKTPSISGIITDGLVAGDTPEKLEEKVISANEVWVRIGWKQWSAKKYAGITYMEDV